MKASSGFFKLLILVLLANLVVLLDIIAQAPIEIKLIDGKDTTISIPFGKEVDIKYISNDPKVKEVELYLSGESPYKFNDDLYGCSLKESINRRGSISDAINIFHKTKIDWEPKKVIFHFLDNSGNYIKNGGHSEFTILYLKLAPSIEVTQSTIEFSNTNGKDYTSSLLNFKLKAPGGISFRDTTYQTKEYEIVVSNQEFTLKASSDKIKKWSEDKKDSLDFQKLNVHLSKNDSATIESFTFPIKINIDNPVSFFKQILNVIGKIHLYIIIVFLFIIVALSVIVFRLNKSSKQPTDFLNKQLSDQLQKHLQGEKIDYPEFSKLIEDNLVKKDSLNKLICDQLQNYLKEGQSDNPELTKLLEDNWVKIEVLSNSLDTALSIKDKDQTEDKLAKGVFQVLSTKLSFVDKSFNEYIEELQIKEPLPASNAEQQPPLDPPSPQQERDGLVFQLKANIDTWKELEDKEPNEIKNEIKNWINLLYANLGEDIIDEEELPTKLIESNDQYWKTIGTLENQIEDLKQQAPQVSYELPSFSPLDSMLNQAERENSNEYKIAVLKCLIPWSATWRNDNGQFIADLNQLDTNSLEENVQKKLGHEKQTVHAIVTNYFSIGGVLPPELEVLREYKQQLDRIKYFRLQQGTTNYTEIEPLDNRMQQYLNHLQSEIKKYLELQAESLDSSSIFDQTQACLNDICNELVEAVKAQNPQYEKLVKVQELGAEYKELLEEQTKLSSNLIEKTSLLAKKEKDLFDLIDEKAGIEEILTGTIEDIEAPTQTQTNLINQIKAYNNAVEELNKEIEQYKLNIEKLNDDLNREKETSRTRLVKINEHERTISTNRDTIREKIGIIAEEENFLFNKILRRENLDEVIKSKSNPLLKDWMLRRIEVYYSNPNFKINPFEKADELYYDYIQATTIRRSNENIIINADSIIDLLQIKEILQILQNEVKTIIEQKHPGSPFEPLFKLLDKDGNKQISQTIELIQDEEKFAERMGISRQDVNKISLQQFHEKFLDNFLLVGLDPLNRLYAYACIAIARGRQYPVVSRAFEDYHIDTQAIQDFYESFSNKIRNYLGVELLVPKLFVESFQSKEQDVGVSYVLMELSKNFKELRDQLPKYVLYDFKSIGLKSHHMPDHKIKPLVMPIS